MRIIKTGKSNTAAMGFLCAGAALVAASAILFARDPGLGGLYPPCPFHYLTGLYCPGCGSLRATHQLLHGNLSGALAFNPLFVISLPVLPLLRLRSAWVYRPWVAWFAFGTVLAFGVARNFPCWPFLLLAPK